MKRTASLLAAITLAIATAPAAAHAEPRPLPAAGADLVSVRLDGDALSVRVRDAGQARRGEPGHDPAAVTFGGGMAGTVPDRAEFGFLGKAGTPVWVLGGAGGFPFWDTTAIPRGRIANETVTLRLRDVAGPGRFHAYTVSSFGVPTPLLGTSEAGPRAMTLPVGIRTGAALWAFDAPGSYRVTLDASAGQLTTTATYRIEVPEISPASPPQPPAKAVPAPPALRTPPTSPPADTLEAPEARAAPKVAAQAAAAPASGRKVFADGHIDMGPQLSGNTWRIRIRDDTGSPPVWRELSDVVIHAVDKAKIKVPSGADYSFLGPAGSDVWLLPQAQQSGIVWPGWNTQDPSVVGGTRGNVTWRLTTVDGPGQFKLFLTGSFGKPNVLFDSAKSLPQQLSIPPNTHAHGNWAFTKPGVYRLGVQMTGTTKAGQSVTDSRTLNVAVGPVDPNTGFGGGSSGGGENGGGSNGGGSLARTGSGWVVPAVAGGALLLIVGASLVVATRRRARSA
ncbi:TIGR03773 family transporter-associated surface protein [Phytohabitans sp. LJ34]|uniref:TIGR03773 family transporter-associated surface protein n=1 Tax=Phytohabitans sp. LJ34 TaxID=3452217 RepID=UPI003F8C15BA